MKRSIFFPWVLIAFVLGSCGPSKPEEITKQSLFKIRLGSLEDEMNLFTTPKLAARDESRMYFYEGIVFIANGPAKKIMEFNSYGDLLTLIYNPDSNPEPVQAVPSKLDTRLRSRRATAYDFQQIGDLAVGKDHLYVRDRLPASRRVFEDSWGTNLDQVILRFDRKGKYLDYLGQEGLGGKAFPVITRLQVTENNELVVICRTPSGWPVFWYNSSGALIHKQVLDFSKVPWPQEKPEGSLSVNLEALYGDWNSRRLWVQVTYYEKVLDEVTKAEAGVGFFQSRVYSYLMENGTYEGYFPVPRLFKKEKTSNPEETINQELPYEFLGPASGGRFFFLSAPDEGDNRLLVVDDRGKTLAEKNLRISEGSLIIRQFFVSPQGILSAMLSTGEDVELAVWRSDKITGFLNVQNPFR